MPRVFLRWESVKHLNVHAAEDDARTVPSESGGEGLRVDDEWGPRDERGHHESREGVHVRPVAPADFSARVCPEEDRPREGPGQERRGQREVRIQDLEQIIVVLDLANRPFQVRDAFREHQRSREADAGDLRHRAVDSERVEAEQVDLDVTTKAGEDLERLEGEAPALADVGPNEEDAHYEPSCRSPSLRGLCRFRSDAPSPSSHPDSPVVTMPRAPSRNIGASRCTSAPRKIDLGRPSPLFVRAADATLRLRASDRSLRPGPSHPPAERGAPRPRPRPCSSCPESPWPRPVSRTPSLR